MKFTVITPVFNGQEFIKETIDSVLMQSYSNFEYIIWDCNSTDGTSEIIKSYNDPRIKHIRKKDNGQSDAIQKCIDKSSGQYISWLNYDDLFNSEKILEEISFFIINNNYPSLIYSDDILINEDGNFIKQRSYKKFNKFALCFYKSLSQPSTFINIKIFNKYNIDKSLDYSFDLDLWLKIFHDNSLTKCYFSKVISRNRVHKNRKMVKFRKYADAETLILRSRYNKKTVIFFVNIFMRLYEKIFYSCS